MGQKVNPTSLRLGVNRTWDSRWYADDKYADYLHVSARLLLNVLPKKPELQFILQDPVL